jgi:hypothetical protein
MVKNAGGTMLKLLGRPDGKLLAVGQTMLGPDGMEKNALKLLQLSKDGVADATFGTAGLIQFVLPAPITSLGAIRGVQLLPDGALLVYALGVATGAQGGSFLWKVTPAGAFDAAFGIKNVGIKVAPVLFGGAAPANRLLVDGNTAWVVDQEQVETRPGTLKNFFKVSKTTF